MKTLVLEIVDFVSDAQFRWRLQDVDGAFVADHAIELDRNATEYGGYVDLHGFARWNAPGSAEEDERALVERVGQWLRKEVWGPVGDAVLKAAEREPTVVRVKVPRDARALLFRPFELGLVLDESSGALDVSLVFDLAGEDAPPEKRNVGAKVRMLALFSMPTNQAALNVQRERHALRKLMERVTHAAGRAVELRILQYGVTPELLAEVLEEGDGWDLIHFSGHGLPAGLMFETEDGKANLVRSDEFADLLWPARAQLKLVTLSSCESGAATAAHAMQLLGVAGAKELRESGTRADDMSGETPLPALAQQLAAKLGCAALAMRYPVEDGFAINLSTSLYESLLAHGQPLPRALQRALRKTVPPGADRLDFGLSLATPTLFGDTALDLKLDPPREEPPTFDPSQAKLSFFEPEPKNFIGRVGPLAAASAALAPKSAYRGVLFHGMAGAGKTACALELAYRHEDRRFEAMAWHRAPSEDQDITGALAQFAVAIETQLKGFEIAHVVGDYGKLKRYLPRIRGLMAGNALLIVLDNIESLLSEDGKWRDPRWGLLIEALIDHDGLSRLVLTSRTPPAEVSHDPRMRVEPIHSLSARETVLLAREMPNLRQLMESGGEVGQPAGRELVRQVLELVQGNPKLLELADRQATDAITLQARIAEANEAWAGKADLDAFFATGEPDDKIEAEDFLRVIQRWTNGIAATLSEEEQLAFQLICCLEPGDRIGSIVSSAWKGLWRNLKRDGDVPDPMSAITAIAAQGLIDIAQQADASTFRIHPAIEQAEQKETSERVRSVVDLEMALTWKAMYDFADDRDSTGMVVRSGLAVAPYLLRQGKPGTAAAMIGSALSRDPSLAILATAMPHLERALTQARGTPAERVVRGVLLKAKAALRSEDVIPEMRELLDLLRQEENFLDASVIAVDFINALLRAGRLREAEEIVDSLPEITRRAELGPWSEIADEGLRLRLMKAKGEPAEVLVEAERLQKRMDALPEQSDKVELSPAWNIREALLSTARSAAISLREWQKALDFSAAVRESEVARGAPELERARSDFNDYGPLLELNRIPEAEAVLRRLRRVVEENGDVHGLGVVFGALASLEARRGHIGEAIAFEHRGLRFRYSFGEPDSITISHNNLANYLTAAEGDPEEIIAHRLAKALINYQMESGKHSDGLDRLANSLRILGKEALPDSFETLCVRIDRIDGVDFGRFFRGLPQRAPSGEEALAKVIGDVMAQIETMSVES